MPSTIFSFPRSATSPKIHVSHAEISQSYLEPSQPPQKRIPFRHINSNPYIHNVTVCMPQRSHMHLCGLDTTNSSPLNASVNYAKAILKLSDILDDYSLRTGNLLLLSSSDASSHDVIIHLNCGKLTIEMPQQIYQRSGLTFPATKHQSGGRKHEKTSLRYRVVVDLRAPNMVKGKKGFERLLWASREVEGLREGRVWLVAALDEYQGGKGRKRKRAEKGEEGGSAETVVDMQAKGEDPLKKHHPTLVTDGGKMTTQRGVLVPKLISKPSFFSRIHEQAAASRQQPRGGTPTLLEEDIFGIVEYLSLLDVQSPRVTERDYGMVDTGICRYELPAASPAFAQVQHGELDIPTAKQSSSAANEKPSVEDMVQVSYSGLIPSHFVTQLVIDLISRSRSASQQRSETDEEESQWIVLSVRTHQTEATGGVDGYVILLQSGEDGTSQKANEKPASRRERDEEDAVGGDEQAADQGSGSASPGQVHAKGESGARREFRYVTCFEFVDSVTG